MPAPLPPIVRQRIYHLWEKGVPPIDIARRLHLAVRSVRRLCRAFEQHGEAALLPAYPHATASASTPILDQALFLHQQHPTWGAPFLRIRLCHLHPGVEIPSARTLQRWFRRHQHSSTLPGRKPASEQQRAQRPHEVWQMDAVDQLRLASGRQVSWLRWIDEFSGAVLGTVVFPPGELWASSRDRGACRLPPAVGPLGPAFHVAC